MTTATPELLTVPDVMAQLKLGRSKVYDLIRSRRLVSIKIDGARRIPADAIRDFVLGQIEEAA
ncbi:MULTISPECIES: helix-turn-helix domain-containing protein [Streptomyces]|jgi:excisionase family DNA binding protein|uniref:helix-turn-helix domain-containing protein n=1 Tax=Streptomyces TaxID=1883 RepID=UPI00076587AE|nr:MULTISPECIES: helix-turn-helix domain-containing protein [Streptomyces]MCX5348930.1 helix-turn-helix domain-containing protein [Streptomyces mirabilis]QDN77790.1 helix-turn-helix domain-containing protein [Streptomyces sp. S1A1-7]QDO08288.1 helix-turn-helix domain-containing protein [Streptomyces sp. S1D4-23]